MGNGFENINNIWIQLLKLIVHWKDWGTHCPCKLEPSKDSRWAHCHCFKYRRGEEHGEETAFTFGLDSSVWRVTEQSLGGTSWDWFGCHRVRKMDSVSFVLWFAEKKQALALAHTFSHFFLLPSSLPSPAHLQHLSPAFDLSLSVIKRSRLSLVSIAVIKRPNPRQTGKESVYLAHRIQSIVRRSQCRKLEAGTAADVRRITSCWLLLWPHSASCFIHKPGPAAQGWRHPQWASPSHIHH